MLDGTFSPGLRYVLQVQVELTRQFTSARVEAAEAYFTGKYVDHADKTIHRRHQKLASALALIGASSPDAKTVTACSVEVSFLKGNNELEGSNDPEGGDDPGGSDDPVGSDGPGGDPVVVEFTIGTKQRDCRSRIGEASKLS
jgi:hypothetical protein